MMSELAEYKAAAIDILDRLAEFLTEPNRRGALKSAKIALELAQTNPDASILASAALDYAIAMLEQEIQQNVGMQ